MSGVLLLLHRSGCIGHFVGTSYIKVCFLEELVLMVHHSHAD